MATVRLENLVKTYPEKKGRGVSAVRGISLEVASGEFMVLVGPSGCGKSTTLRMIAGLEEITEGRISIDGQVVNDVLPKDRDIAMVFQNYALYPHMSVFENMAFGLKLRKLPHAEIEQRVGEAAALLGLEGLLERKPKALSGGQRQRVALGRAIVRKPKVFLFDEPLSNLDAAMRGSTRIEIAKLHARLGATMIYVTHDQTEAMTMGDRICVMKDGEIMQVAEPLTLYDKPANLFVGGFIGAPPMNFFAGTLQRAGEACVFAIEPVGAVGPHGAGGQKATLTLPREVAMRVESHVGKSVILGVRPEHVAVGESDDAAKEAATLTARIELVEPLGADTFLHLAAGDRPFIVRASPSTRFAASEILRVRFDFERARFFDAVTGGALGA